MADPLLQGRHRYPMRGLYQALAVAAMCLQEQATTRPLIGDVITALTYLASQNYDPIATSARNDRASPSTPRVKDIQKNLAGGPRNQHTVHSPHRDSPRKREARGANIGIGDSGRKWSSEGLEKHESQRDSPGHAGKAKDSPMGLNCSLDRERTIAEAKVWGENWREIKRTNAAGSFDSTNE